MTFFLILATQNKKGVDMSSFIKSVLILFCVLPVLWSFSDFCSAQDNITGTYKYVSRGYAGKLEVVAKGTNEYHIELSTAKVDTGHGCSFSGMCTVKNNKIYCTNNDDGIESNAEFDIVKKGLNLVEYNPHMFLCGMQGQMHGFYKR